ncbi:long-chain-fatty-acid--CoA ligase 5-like [Tropilaelaps mercedesae]|uniref:Long-chain-fatty-acid--CoA ligase n=1 Tax=Tropilaelaps mercedesae TaxID=418985 RepID=A0A1V9XXY3_9ACAR|nr:long-chain-fatty-acid--CoA ligase 5-like [Tropilaelaps mercedesae]
MLHNSPAEGYCGECSGSTAATGVHCQTQGTDDEAGKQVVGTLGWTGYLGGYYGAMAASGVAGLVMSYLCSNSNPVIPPISQDNQSREMVGLGEKVRTSRLLPPGKFMEYLYEDAQTLFDVMYRGARVSNNGRCMAWREPGAKDYSYIHYNQALERIRNFACGQAALGSMPGQGTYIGVFMQNCVEAIVAEQACYYLSQIIVPLYDTLGTAAVTFIINQASIEVVVCDSTEKVELLLRERSECPQLKRIIHTKEVADKVTELAKDVNIELIAFAEVEKLGEKHFRHPLPPNRNEMATVCYTSGTTGNPKGVMLSHKNIIACLSSVMFQLGEVAPCKDDVMISFLPLAHMLERCCEMALYMVGGCVGFFSGDIRGLVDDMRALRPTISPTVPRLLNRIHDRVEQVAQSSVWKRALLALALKSKESEMKKFVIRRNSIWDKIIFKTVQEGFGGRMRLMVVGSAPLATNVINMVRCALGAVIVEGYGQTECTAPCTLTFPGDYEAGHVGPPIAACAIKLVDVAEMEYYACNGEGEICVKGPTIFQGYLNDREKTEEVLDANGWLHTGDIGKWMENGTLKVIDRKKHIFKLSQGEYIAPEKLENIFIRSPFVAQIFVHGESLKSCLIAVVVPDEQHLLAWAAENRISGTFEELCVNRVVKKSIIDDLAILGKKSGLKSFELLKDILCYPELFSIENGLLTPTLKTKRPECRKAFAEQIKDMYRLLQ